MSMPSAPQPQPQPQQPATNRTATSRTALVVTISVLAAILILLGIGVMQLAMQNGIAFAPTPTATPTARPAHTPTPDVRATHVAEDMLTQVAFAATLVSNVATGTIPADLPVNRPNGGSDSTPGAVMLPIIVDPGAAPTDAVVIETAQPGSTAIYMPNIENRPTPTALPPTLTPPSVPLPPAAAPTLIFPTPNAPPVGQPQPQFPTPVFPTPEFPTPEFPTPVFPTPVPPPTPLPPTPILPTATLLPVGGELAATMRSVDTSVRVGPSNVYTVAAIVAANTSLRLRGRTPAGDWVYACCIPNTATSFWVRRAYVTIANNSLPSGAPSDADPNSASWLAVQPLDAALIARPTPTGVPLGDFPLARFDHTNSGRVPTLPNPPLQQAWTVFPQAAQGFTSPAAVSGANVLAASADNELYSHDLTSGSQRWRYSLQRAMQLAPAIQDGLIYLTYGGLTMASLQEQGNAVGLIWQSDLPFNATSPMTIWLDTIFIGSGEGGDARLMAIRRLNPSDRREFVEPNARVQQPAIGQETIFVGADRLWAIDINIFAAQEIVWTSPDVFNVSAPPVYVSPGVMRLAELFAADGSGVVHALDANTGVSFWTHSFGAAVTALAVNDSSVFIAGNGVLRAVSRRDGSVQWTLPVGGAIVGGPLVTNSRALVVVQSGGIFLVDAGNGGILDAAASVPAQVSGGAAISGLQVLIPAANNTLYAYRGAP